MPYSKVLTRMRGLLAATFIAASMSGIAMAETTLPQSVADKLVNPDRVAELLDRDDNSRIPIIVEFAAPPVPDAANFESADAADAAHIASVHGVQDEILGRVFSLQGGAAGAAASDELHLKRMDFSPMFALTVDSDTLARLADDPAVVRIHEDVLDRVDLNVGSPNSLERIQMPAAYSVGATGNLRRVAILDTGGRRTHEFLSSRIISAACYGTNNAGQGSSSYCPGGATSSTLLDSANDCDAPTIRGCGHGTHVAGTAAGFNTSLSSGEPAHGVARSGRIISINVFSRFTNAACTANGYAPYANGCVLTWSSDQILGLNRVYALRNTYNIDAVNMSLGGGQYSSHCDTDSRKQIIDLLRGAGIATVISAGNSGYNSSVGAPACISSAITVASSTKADARSSFSNWGSMIDVVAPGSSINASYTSGTSNSHYAQLSGTSMAAPHVTGAFAAIRSLAPTATVSQIEVALENSGTNITSSSVTKRRINVSNALASLGLNIKAAMTSPSPGSTLTGTSVTFQWSPGVNALNYFLYVGSTVGGYEYYNSGTIAPGSLSRTATNIPANGSLVRVRLWTRFASGWQTTDYTYTANPGVKSSMISPSSGSTLTGPTVTFSWNTGLGVTSRWLYVGSTVGGAQYLNSGSIAAGTLSRQVTNLPVNGSTVYVRLYSYISTGWQHTDYTYTASPGAKSALTSPTPGSTLVSSTANFQWNTGSGALERWLFVGSTVGGTQYHNSGTMAPGTLSRQVTGLPTNGSTVHVRLYTRISSGWQSTDYTYTAATASVMTWPTPGSTLINPWATFQWTATGGASGYWLMVGTGGVGSANILSAAVASTTRGVPGLPQIGPVYVRLMTYVGGSWKYNDYAYTMAVPAVMATPVPGSTLAGPGVMFQWTGHASISNYWLYVGTTGAGSGNIISTAVNNTWRWVGGIPASGTVNVRLMSWVGGAWRYRDYTYQGGVADSAVDAGDEDGFSGFIQNISLE